jgi:uncharacterized membrane protein
MNPQKLLADGVEAEGLKMQTRSQKQQLEPQKSQAEKMTLGHRLADNLAAKVGSWSFLIAQTGVLSAWVGMNLMPGVPHWDESPFILLNLVFSFASAYTAPIVLMSQNRQSDVDRENAEYDHQVNLKAGQNIELLHEKIDSLQAQQLKELTQIVKEQQRCLNEIKASVVPALKQPPQYLNEIKASVVPALQEPPRYLNEIKVTDSNFPKGYSVYIPSNLDQPIGNNSKVVEALTRREE